MVLFEKGNSFFSILLFPFSTLISIKISVRFKCISYAFENEVWLYLCSNQLYRPYNVKLIVRMSGNLTRFFLLFFKLFITKIKTKVMVALKAYTLRCYKASDCFDFVSKKPKSKRSFCFLNFQMTLCI